MPGPAARPTRWTPALLLGTLLAVSSLAGCRGTGDGGPPTLPAVGGPDNGERDRLPAQVLLDARAALLASPAVAAVGDLALPGGHAVVDLLLTREGGVSGSLAVGTRRLQVLRRVTGGVPTAVVRGDAALAASMGAAAPSEAAADFVAVPAGDDAALSALALPRLAERLVPTVPQAVPEAGATVGDVDGTRAVVVVVAGARISVSDSGTPEPLRVAGGPAVPGVLDLDTTADPALPSLPSPGATP